jgi:small-conductance mechanosensitive channel
MDFTTLKTTVLAYVQPYLDMLIGWLTSPQFYAQVGAIIAAVLIGRFIAAQIVKRVPLLSAEPTEGKLLRYRQLFYSCRDLLKPLLVVVALAIAAAICDAAVGSSWLVRIAQSAAVISLLYAVINRFIAHPVINAAARWIGLPVAALLVFGYFDETIAWLDTVALQAGNIRISALAIAKALFFGGMFFWLGRISSNAGQSAIRRQESVDVQTREIAAKGVELLVFAVVLLLLLNVLGLDLSTLALFSGALGVGLGFGLQQIAANFISGIIILLERSLKVGDFIELEDGRTGTLRDINMRSSRLATFDGKDIMVPNERFITTRFVNWTQEDSRQRYEASFVVKPDTNVPDVKRVVEAALAGYKPILSDPEPVSCDIARFGEFGIHFTVKYWVDGLDEGKNSFSSDVLMLIWQALKSAGINMAFRER